MPKPIEAILIGAGQRGAEAYAPYALRNPDRLRFVAVAEPDSQRRARFAALHNIPANRQYADWESLLAQPQLGEAALICTQDWLHTAPALAALRGGYHVLLEKPMATSAAECRQLVETSEARGRQLHICHVLRYTSHFQKMRAIIQSGSLGEIVDVAHRENVSYWHMAHSYVRGNWRNSRQSSPMILAKCCHDFDILLWLLDQRCERLSSSGGLAEFRAENAPPGAPMRCTDGCPASDTCLYYAPWVYRELTPLWRSIAGTGSGFKARAVRTYLQAPRLFHAAARLIPLLRRVTEYRGWPLTVLADNPTPAAVEQALREGPYGRCVYHCDNDVVDHQAVLMEFEGHLPVTLTMHGHSPIEYRTTRIEGTRARLDSAFGLGGSHIRIAEHRSGRQTRYDTSAGVGSSHGGGDFALVSAFLDSLQQHAEARTTARQALTSHLMAFAAEQARLDGSILKPEAIA